MGYSLMKAPKLQNEGTYMKYLKIMCSKCEEILKVSFFCFYFDIKMDCVYFCDCAAEVLLKLCPAASVIEVLKTSFLFHNNNKKIVLYPFSKLNALACICM